MFLWAATTALPLSTAARNFGQQIEREDSMKVDLEFEFDAEELASIASHRGKESASEAEVRSFIREAITKALGDAIVAYKAVQNDPSANVGP
jgi:hypothetical protein